jgi:hypothetical protein
VCLENVKVQLPTPGDCIARYEIYYVTLQKCILYCSLTVLLLLGSGLELFSTRLEAQVISGDLVRTVADATGSLVPNATVTAVNAATRVRATASTNAIGL